MEYNIPLDGIPSRAQGAAREWDAFPLGVSDTGEEVLWATRRANGLLVGGKNRDDCVDFLKHLLNQAIASNLWKVKIVDIVSAALAPTFATKWRAETATNISTTFEMLTHLAEEMHRRYDLMQQQSVNCFTKMVPAPVPILLVLDDISAFSPSGGSHSADKSGLVMRDRSLPLLSSLVRLGKAAGIYVACATTHPKTMGVPGELRVNLTARVAIGRFDEIESLMILNSLEAARDHVSSRDALVCFDGGESVRFRIS